MKIKKIIYSILTVMIIAVAIINVQIALKSEIKAKFSSLASIFTLAMAENNGSIDENGYDNCHLSNYGKEKKVERCSLQLGGGMFTSSVEKKCNIVPDANKTCTPAACGEVF
jgi:Flp pilus assembly pilin Flp